MRRKFNLQNKITKSRIILLLFCFATLFIGIGYASINSVILELNGTVEAKAQDGLFITEVNYISNNNANENDSKINRYYQTTLDSTITLAENDLESSITYEIVMYNKSNENTYFSKVTFLDELYDNKQITYTLTGISKGDAVGPYSQKSFFITFKYIAGTTQITNNTLNSYLNFEFKKIGTMKAINSSSYNGEFWGYRDSITKIIFQNEVNDIDGAISFDISQEENGTVMSRLVLNEDNSTYTAYIQGNFTINAPANSAYLLAGFSKLQSIENINYLNTSKVISMRYMFNNNKSLTSLDLSSFDTSNVINMHYMFSYCSSLTDLNLKNFDTRKVTDISYMFVVCSNLTSLDLSDFNTENVTNMKGVFQGCGKIKTLDLSNFDTSNVLYMGNHSENNYGGMFQDCPSLESVNISSFKTSKVTLLANMFWGCKSLKEIDLSNFDVSNVTDTGGMFFDCQNLTTLNLSNFNTKKITSMFRMFEGCKKLENLDISKFDTSSVTNMGYMFSRCSKLQTLDLSSFDMSNVTNSEQMLNGTTEVVNAYARTENDAAILNAMPDKPTTYTFTVL